jgi:HlyD family secretion protein
LWKTKNENQIQGKLKRTNCVVSKIPVILKIFVKEEFGDKGHLGHLDIPEVDAKKRQAEGALTSANAQYNMAVNGTNSQIKQLEKAKKRTEEQYEFAKINQTTRQHAKIH